MGDVVKINFHRAVPLPAHHKGWPQTSGAQTHLGPDGQDGERRLAARELDLKAHKIGDGVTQKLLKYADREKVRETLRLVQPDIDRDR